MLKRCTTVLAFAMVLTALLTSCSIDEALLNKLTLGLSDRILNEDLSEDKHNVIEIVYGDDDWYSGIVYSGNNYYMDPYEIFFVTDNWHEKNENDLMLSWNGFRFGYIDLYYSYTDNAPVFIYKTRLGYTYFHEDYDYMTDVFEIEGTELKVSISDFVDFDNAVKEYSPANVIAEITLISQTNTRIKCNVRICEIDNILYSSVGNYPYYRMELAEDILQRLKDNNIIK